MGKESINPEHIYDGAVLEQPFVDVPGDCGDSASSIRPWTVLNQNNRVRTPDWLRKRFSDQAHHAHHVALWLNALDEQFSEIESLLLPHVEKERPCWTPSYEAAVRRYSRIAQSVVRKITEVSRTHGHVIRREGITTLIGIVRDDDLLYYSVATRTLECIDTENRNAAFIVYALSESAPQDWVYVPAIALSNRSPSARELAQKRAFKSVRSLDELRVPND